MGSVLSVFGAAKDASWNSNNKRKYYDYNRPFVDMLKGHHLYGEWLNAETEYEMKLVHKFPDLHWYLLVKKEGSQTLPYITFEISTRIKTVTNLIPVNTELIPVTRNFNVCKSNATNLGVFRGCLLQICQLADEVVSEMKTYHLFTRNCQNFCNNLLKKLGKREFTTTFSPDTTEENYDRTINRDFDLICKVIPEVKHEEDPVPTTAITSESIAKRPVVVHSATTVWKQRPRLRRHDSKPCKVFGSKVVVLTNVPSSRISSKPSANDLQALLGILAPLEDKWKAIGHQLALLPCTLNHNQGMRNMLMKYFQEPTRSWDQLANAVAKFDRAAAQAIIRLSN